MFGSAQAEEEDSRHRRARNPLRGGFGLEERRQGLDAQGSPGHHLEGGAQDEPAGPGQESANYGIGNVSGHSTQTKSA